MNTLHAVFLISPLVLVSAMVQAHGLERFDMDTSYPGAAATYRSFSVNPAAKVSKGLNVGAGTLRKTRSGKLTTESSSGKTVTSSESVEDMSEVSSTQDLGGGSLLGVGVFFTDRANKSRYERDGSNMQTVMEVWRSQKADLSLAIPLTPNARIGLGLSYLWLDHDMLGSFFVSEEERTVYKGGLIGYSLGVHFGEKNGGVGLAYMAPPRGKVNAEGENKIATEPGALVLDAGIALVAGFNFNAGYRRWVYQRDDRLTYVLAPGSETRISLLGVDVDVPFYPVQDYLLGFDYHMGDIVWRVAAVQREDQYMSFGDLPADAPNSENKFTHVGGKTSLGLEKGDLQFDVGYGYNNRAFTIKNSYSSDSKYDATAYYVYAVLCAPL